MYACLGVRRKKIKATPETHVCVSGITRVTACPGGAKKIPLPQPAAVLVVVRRVGVLVPGGGHKHGQPM
jgi:hypothetical protein